MDINISQVCQLLDTTSTREDAKVALLLCSKHDLTVIARHYGIPLLSNDTVSRMKEKIIENTVGLRLRTQAIYSTPLK